VGPNSCYRRVYWISPHPNHYHSFLLGKLKEIEKIDIVPVYVFLKISRYPWETNFTRGSHSYVLNRKLLVDWCFVWRIVAQERRSLILVAGWNDATTFVLLTVLALLGRDFVLYSDTPDVRLKRKGFLQLMRGAWLRFIYLRMCRYLVTGMVGVNALEALNVPQGKIVNFPFATDTDFFAPAASPVFNPVMRLFSSGRLDIRHKGYDIVLRALAELRAANPSLKFHYYIAGSGPDEVAIIEQINRYGLSCNVTLLGWLEPNMLLKYYQTADFFVHPSNFDPYPNAVLEAMSCGLPVIGSNLAGSVVDRVINGVTGYIFDSGNVNDLKDCLEVCFNTNGEQMNIMRANCRSVALQWGVNYHLKTFKHLLHLCSTPIC
jgi:glycosyltransferase involved in cell wall biosynthesis